MRVLVHCEDDRPGRSRDRDYLDCPVRVWHVRLEARHRASAAIAESKSVLDRPLDDQPGTKPRELGQHLLPIIDQEIPTAISEEYRWPCGIPMSPVV